MSRPPTPLMRVRDWDRLYENNRSREIKRTEWFPASNDLSADAYVELVSHPDGATHLGVWIGVLMVASRAKPKRGFLIREDGQPHTNTSLARVTRLPENLIQIAIERLLDIGLLEIVGSDEPKINGLPPHPGAGFPQNDAGTSQKGAAEGNGTEHHHREGNGKEKKGTERAEHESTPGHHRARSTIEKTFPRGSDDEPNPAEAYASPEDELKATYLERAGEPITVAVLDAIRLNLEMNRVTFDEFVSALKSHQGGNWKNPAGFLRSFSKRFRVLTQPAVDPVTVAEAEEKNYRCPFCGSRKRWEGAVLGPNGSVVPCQCAGPEYIAKQQARGIFTDGNPR